jgi:hypothetical protein
MEADVWIVQEHKELSISIHTHKWHLYCKEKFHSTVFGSLEFSWITGYKLPQNFRLSPYHLQLEILNTGPINSAHSI